MTKWKEFMVFINYRNIFATTFHKLHISSDMRRGMNSLALQVQEKLGRDPHAGDLYVFRGKRGHLIKILWHDGIGMSLYAKRLERGRFTWPSPADGTVAITSAQLAYLLDGIDWRNPLRTWRPAAAG
jgi:transposase